MVAISSFLLVASVEERVKKAKHRHSGARALPASPEPMNTRCRTYRKYRCSWVPGSALRRPGMTFLGKANFLTRSEAGVQGCGHAIGPWVPAFASMTEKGADTKRGNRTATISAAVNPPMLRSAEPSRTGDHPRSFVIGRDLVHKPPETRIGRGDNRQSQQVQEAARARRGRAPRRRKPGPLRPQQSRSRQRFARTPAGRKIPRRQTPRLGRVRSLLSARFVGRTV
jgi:hypothetical protein